MTDIVYELPLHERVRLYLRLEFLFAQYAHHRSDTSEYGLRAGLHALQDILTVMGRSDLKNELIRELQDRQLAAEPHEEAWVEGIQALQNLPWHFAGTGLRENDFLTSLQSRLAIAGGSCGFDLPQYHHWLNTYNHAPPTQLDRWFAQIEPIGRAISLYLSLLRNQGSAEAKMAQNGALLYTPSQNYLLLRVLLPMSEPVYPEISAGRHRYHLRFMQPAFEGGRSLQVLRDVPFLLHCCGL